MDYDTKSYWEIILLVYHVKKNNKKHHLKSRNTFLTFSRLSLIQTADEMILERNFFLKENV